MGMFAWFCIAVAGLLLVLGLLAARRATRPLPSEHDARVIRMIAVARCPYCGLLVSCGPGGRSAHTDPYTGMDCAGGL